MKKKFSAKIEFLLPDDFEGSYVDSLKEYVKYLEQNGAEETNIPQFLPEQWHFAFALGQGKKSCHSYSIELFGLDSQELEDLLDE
jgi:hypothetical protein